MPPWRTGSFLLRHDSPEKRQMPPMEYLHQERKKKGVTLTLLWHEYKQANPDGYQYSQFCELYRQWTQNPGCLSPPGIPGRGKTLRRLCRPNHSHPGSLNRRDSGSLSLCGRPGRQQLHLRRGHPGAGPFPPGFNPMSTPSSFLAASPRSWSRTI